MLKTEIISQDSFSLYSAYIPADAMKELKKKKSICIGLCTENGKPCGAVVFSNGQIPDNDEKVMVIESVSIDKLYRTKEVIVSIIDEVSEKLRSRNIAGIVLQILYPREKEYEDLLDEGFERLEDGNTIYEASFAQVYKNPIIQRLTLLGKDCRVSPVSGLSATETKEFLSDMGKRFPETFSPKHLPGTWLKDLSLVYYKGERIEGYVLCSSVSDEMIYVGALYIENNDNSVLSALLGILGKKIHNESSFTKVMFAAASDEGKKICDYMVNDVEDVKLTVVHNFYKSIN
ncbi:MAG: hypothetical protein K6F99_03835 [Lachnospiraceae bacterium]|nr:hypothetical protein [Lachnospiraceae bacterium]